ncbi:pitrilysin family protein [Solidesulfovibrio sp.]|uniref:M16 family metallopeptidase n=1 Tax=Solidesulfovibrio sp. TaxID=2910990 RepID=UPI000EE18BF6|nr:pitrilysin family protein [Solidesulfovibrio sp.]MEA5088828.1 pitrilysin family protein [Solidesulfovibrio sp.]HCR12925.1 insulinase family protein [Desulfovibrio sp.]HML62769.1 pitrilysin family protein [Solidesulfovibrio sp.]
MPQLSDDIPCRVTRLPNGVRVVTEAMPQVKTASLGVWIEAGSRHEAKGQEGLAHLWEHMAFKGTASRDALAIAKELDILGGLANAFTSREATCFHIRVMDAHFRRAFDVLADIALNPRLDPEELAREQAVILQEISMVEETPEEKVHEDFWAAAWAEPAIAHAITGTPRSVTAATPKTMQAWRRAHYRPGAIAVVATGAVSHEVVVDMAAATFGSLPAAQGPVVRPAGAFTPPKLAVRRESEQNHVILAYPSVGNKSPERFAHTLLATLLGGNMSSRLFQEVREKRGLAYSIYASVSGLADAGIFEIQAAVEPERTRELLSVVRAELAAVAGGAVTAEELDHTREHLKGLLYLGAESTENRMMRLARNILLFGREIPLEETAAALDNVSLDELAAIAGRAFTEANTGLCILGPTAAIP